MNTTFIPNYELHARQPTSALEIIAERMHEIAYFDDPVYLQAIATLKYYGVSES